MEFQRIKGEAGKSCEVALSSAKRVRDEGMAKAWKLREETIDQAWQIYSKMAR